MTNEGCEAPAVVHAIQRNSNCVQIVEAISQNSAGIGPSGASFGNPTPANDRFAFLGSRGWN